MTGSAARWRPTPEQVRAALSRANRIVWTTWVAVTFVVAGVFVNGHWGDVLTGFACLTLVFVQDDAIKAARLLGHGITNRRGR